MNEEHKHSYGAIVFFLANLLPFAISIAGSPVVLLGFIILPLGAYWWRQDMSRVRNIPAWLEVIAGGATWSVPVAAYIGLNPWLGDEVDLSLPVLQVLALSPFWLMVQMGNERRAKRLSIIQCFIAVMLLLLLLVSANNLANGRGMLTQPFLGTLFLAAHLAVYPGWLGASLFCVIPHNSEGDSWQPVKSAGNAEGCAHDQVPRERMTRGGMRALCVHGIVLLFVGIRLFDVALDYLHHPHGTSLWRIIPAVGGWGLAILIGAAITIVAYIRLGYPSERFSASAISPGFVPIFAGEVFIVFMSGMVLCGGELGGRLLLSALALNFALLGFVEGRGRGDGARPLE